MIKNDHNNPVSGIDFLLVFSHWKQIPVTYKLKDEGFILAHISHNAILGHLAPRQKWYSKKLWQRTETYPMITRRQEEK